MGFYVLLLKICHSVCFYLFSDFACGFCILFPVFTCFFVFGMPKNRFAQAFTVVIQSTP